MRLFGAIGSGQSAHDDAGSWFKPTDPLSHESSHATLDTVAVGRQRDLLLGHDDADESRGFIPSPAGVVVHNQPAFPQRVPRRIAVVKSSPRANRCAAPSTSGGEASATLAASRSEDSATCTGGHALTEAVHLGTTTVVRLVGPLAHGRNSCLR